MIAKKGNIKKKIRCSHNFRSKLERVIPHIDKGRIIPDFGEIVFVLPVLESLELLSTFGAFTSGVEFSAGDLLLLLPVFIEIKVK